MDEGLKGICKIMSEGKGRECQLVRGTQNIGDAPRDKLLVLAATA